MHTGSSLKFIYKSALTVLPVNAGIAFRIMFGGIKSLLLERNLHCACAFKCVQGRPH